MKDMTVNNQMEGQMFYRTARVANYQPDQSQGSAGEVITNIDTNPGLVRNASDNNLKQAKSNAPEFSHAINGIPPVSNLTVDKVDRSSGVNNMVSSSGDRVEIIDVQREKGFLSISNTNNTVLNNKSDITKTRP